MRLTLIYPGDPSKAKIVNAATGEELEGLVDYSLVSPMKGIDELTLCVRIPHGSPNPHHVDGNLPKDLNQNV